jgi:hypothetical protein
VHRGFVHRFPPEILVPGVGDTRFAPLPGTTHTYVSATRTAALLESALHEMSGPDATIYRAQLAPWSLAPMRLVEDVRLVDLRDPQLVRLGVERRQLVDTDPLHYACTRRWAAALQDHHVGGYEVAGIVWHSRQADLHARAQRGGLAEDLLAHRAIEVAVLWHPHGPARPLRLDGSPERLLVGGRGSRLVAELAVLLQAPIER